MTATSKGWEASIQYDASIVAENVGTGDAAETTFRTGQFPIVNSGTYVVTDDENDVTVYLDGVAQGAATFTLTGATGIIVFGAPPGAGVVVTVTYTYRKVAGYARGVNFTEGHGIEPVFAINSRPAVELHEGKYECSGKVDEFWIDRTLMGKAIDENAQAEQFSFTLTVKSKATGGRTYTLIRTKFSSWAYDSTENGFTGNNTSFTAEYTTHA